MEFINGSVIWDPDIPHGTNSDRTQIYESMNKTIKKLHKVDPIKIGLEDFGKPGNYVGRQVARWSKQYELSETEKIPAMDNLIEWLPKNLPSEKPTRLVHGDFSLTNVIVNNDSNEIASILDWELSTLGDPIADFSYHCLRYLDNPVLSNEQECLRLGIPTYKNYVKMYFEGSDFDIKPDEWNLYMAFNMFKIAAILQGITGRVRDGTAAGKDADKLFPQTVELATNAWKLINSN
jgi:aminoglycoside phosphotransferase (APT) family kinase protein